MSIRLKLILFLLSFGFVILAALMWSNQFVLHKTMLHYVDNRDQMRLERLKNNIEVYLQYESVNNVADIPEKRWRRLLFLSHRVDLQQLPSLIDKVLANREAKPESESKTEGPPRPPRPLDEFESRVSLMTVDGQIVFGKPLEETCMKLPVYQEGQLIAQIGYHPLQELIENADIEFADSQFKMLTLGAVIVTLLALILLWPVANHFLTPIRELNQALHALAAGNLTGRLHVKRQDELGALQRDVNYLATVLETAQQSRNQWIADISHELRTPLTILNGSIEAMVDGIRPMNTANLQGLQEEVQVLQRLINDLYQLSLSDVGALQYSMDHLNFSDLIAHAVQSMQAKADSKGVVLETLELPQRASVYGDANRLSQLLSNLLKNAIDYTDAKSENALGIVQVQLAKQEDTWRLVVQDSSPGVSAEELTHLAERFYRTEPSRNRRTGGAGLGLAMVSQIVQAHSGSLAFSDSALGGLKVEVSLPKATLPF